MGNVNVKGKNERKTSFKSNESEDNEEKVVVNTDKFENNNNNKSDKKENVKNEPIFDPLRRQSLNVSSVDSISEKKKKRVMSSIDLKNKMHFLPQIGVRPHSRKKWYSQDTFNPNFLN